MSGQDHVQRVVITWKNAYAVKNDTELNAQQDHKCAQNHAEKKGLELLIRTNLIKGCVISQDDRGILWDRCRLCSNVGWAVSLALVSPELLALEFPERSESSVLHTEPKVSLSLGW